jgi:hypothetical protein
MKKVPVIFTTFCERVGKTARGPVPVPGAPQCLQRMRYCQSPALLIRQRGSFPLERIRGCRV